jgi:hypothetical protein
MYITYIEIKDSVIFQSLSLGFCINASSMWTKNFSTLCDDENPEYQLTPLGILHKQIEKKETHHHHTQHNKCVGDISSVGMSTIRNNFSDIDLGSCHQSSDIDEQKTNNCQFVFDGKWMPLKDMSVFKGGEIKGILHTLRKAPFDKIQAISCLVVTIHGITTDTKKVRLISISSQFYRAAFIVWLIFNIKLFFSITFEQYLVYFKYLMDNWVPSL